MKIIMPVILIFILSSCSGVQKPAEPVERQVASQLVTAKGEENYWWYARFKMVWPEQESKVSFAKDLMIVNELISPVLAMYSDDIKLWRFHRRAVRDLGGHQFSFIFYSSPEIAQRIFKQINNNPVLVELVEADILLELKLDDPAEPGKKALSDTSDPVWPTPLQNSWPYFIMGVSVMYMDLAQQEIEKERIDKNNSVAVRLKQYQQVNDRLTLTWKEYGSHAFFHHMNAMFGYEKLEVWF